MSETAHAMSAAREPGHWLGTDLEESDWRLAIPESVIRELEVASERDVPATLDGLELSATAKLIQDVRHRLFHGCGLVVAGRLPVDAWGEPRTTRAIRILSHLMGPPVRQTVGGTTFYAVEDQGVNPGAGVRRSRTNVRQPFHSDGPWVRLPPWIVGLFCVRAASNGGVSRCISLKELFADLDADAPDLGARLRQDLLWHRQNEHEASESPVSRGPMLWHDEAGRWCCRYYADYVFSGYRAVGESMDALAERALKEVARRAAEPFRWLEFTLGEGEVQWVNNRWCAHGRTEFEARTETDRPRLLVRVWHRNVGDPIALDG